MIFFRGTTLVPANADAYLMCNEHDPSFSTIISKKLLPCEIHCPMEPKQALSR